MFLARLVFWGGVINRLTGWRLSRFNVWIYRVTGGRLGDAVPGARVILLTTTGRKTGRRFTVPVSSWTQGDDLIIGSGAGGAPKEPQWFLNLRVNPSVTVQLKKEVFDAKASVLSETEREAFLAAASPLARFHDRAGRRRPSLVRLSRVA